jgi:hypothetical protein
MTLVCASPEIVTHGGPTKSQNKESNSSLKSVAVNINGSMMINEKENGNDTSITSKNASSSGSTGECNSTPNKTSHKFPTYGSLSTSSSLSKAVLKNK